MYAHVDLTRNLPARHSKLVQASFEIQLQKLPLNFTQNCYNFRHLRCIFNFSNFENIGINNGFEYLGGGDDLEVCTVDGGGVSKI